MIVNITYR